MGLQKVAVSDKPPQSNFHAHGVLFDMDGVLTVNGHFHEQAWHSYALGHLGVTVDDGDPRLHGGRNVDILKAISSRTPTEQEVLHCEEIKEGLYRNLARGALHEVAGLSFYLKWLVEQNVPCALVTSAITLNVEFVHAA